MPDYTDTEMALQYALEQADGHAHDLEMMLRAEKTRVRELEAALTEERHYCSALEHALAGRSWEIAEGGGVT